MTLGHEPSPESLALLDLAACGLLQTLENGTIRRANRTFCTWVGRAPEDVVGVRLQDFLTMGGRIFHHTHWAPLLRMQGSISEVKLDVLPDQKVEPMASVTLRPRHGLQVRVARRAR